MLDTFDTKQYLNCCPMIAATGSSIEGKNDILPSFLGIGEGKGLFGNKSKGLDENGKPIIPPTPDQVEDKKAQKQAKTTEVLNKMNSAFGLFGDVFNAGVELRSSMLAPEETYDIDTEEEVGYDEGAEDKEAKKLLIVGGAIVLVVIGLVVYASTRKGSKK